MAEEIRETSDLEKLADRVRDLQSRVMHHSFDIGALQGRADREDRRRKYTAIFLAGACWGLLVMMIMLP